MKFLLFLRKRNPLLYYAAFLNMLGAVVMLLLILVDDTQILGINRWVKPFKFFGSISIFLGTFGWLSGDLPKTRFVRVFSWQIIIAMFVEILAITGQALRGDISHFNRGSVSGSIIFVLMGIFVLYNTIWVGIFTYRYWKANLSHLSSTYVTGARLGLLLFMIGSALGGYMSAQSGHTVGGVDGGLGVPLVNWSIEYGDLRVAHFFGLHGIQVLMILGVLLPRYILKEGSARTLIRFIFFLLLGLVFWTFLQALNGNPFIRL